MNNNTSNEMYISDRPLRLNNGILVSTEEQQTEECTNYFERLLNKPTPRSRVELSTQVLWFKISTLRNSKIKIALRVDNNPAEIVPRSLCSALLEKLKPPSGRQR